MKKTLTLFLVLLMVAFMSCNQSSKQNNVITSADAIYYGGDIITMEGDSAVYPEAVAVKAGQIAFAGSKVEAEKMKGDSTVMRDLKGKTLVPGFIDGHCHFFAFGSQAISANLLAPPDGTSNNIDDLVNELKAWYQKNGTDKTQGWIVGIGFDDAVLKEKRFPTKDDLDKVSTDLPVMATHISGHFCSVNTKGLEVLGITAASKDPEGGVIRRVKGSKEPNGVLEELAAIPHMFKLVTPPTKELADSYLDAGQKMAASYGYTTCNEGRAMGNHEQMADYATRGKMYLDVNSWIDYSVPQHMGSEWYSKEYKSHYRIAGLKLTLDGSPQGRTAWRNSPYLIPPDGQKKGYKGYPAIPKDEDVQKIVDSAFANNWQLKAHANGDAAADQLFRAIGKASAKYGNEDRRNILIHGQLIRMDQLDSIKKYDIVASLFPMHTFYWGDWYKEIIGPDKAQQISPIKSALKKGIRVTSHTDAPVAFPNMMMILWTSVNRVSRSGTVMGPDEKLTPYEALKSITIWGAEQFFEEEKKGTLTVGKLADMVVLDKNPLKVDPMTLKDIVVLETIKEGKTIYEKK
ncbi:MAG: amidohydrolase [Cytophagales bacterium]|nr:amidohydrolase [Cytophagales bacterium]MCA6366131.1 amidohydrolase [Cytophagales bacterium]MCA6369801.1 amidohydrolase [Cytophagales bacterium]MCA6374489.1 amidohydrolase [Cytophagales bacterium]MCA6384875.1 amidohydrolase [Cytophagales bacterium]